jgi:hypothetical protein
MAPSDWEPEHERRELRFVLEPLDAPERRLVRTSHFLAPGVGGGR